jgi:hypothetical protein
MLRFFLFCWLELLLAMLDFLLVGPDFLRHFLSILAMAAMGFRWIFRDSEDSASMDFEVSEQFPNIKKTPLDSLPWLRFFQIFRQFPMIFHLR